MPFACSICEQESTRICVFCTKDACNIHVCGRCGCCSDCCTCEVPLNEPLSEPMRAPVADVLQSMPASELDLEDLMPPELALSAGVDVDLAELDTELAPRGEEPDTPAERWTSEESQSTTPDEPANEPSETPKV